MMDAHDCHHCVSHDGVTFTCPTCGSEYQLRDGQVIIIIRQGDPDVVHIGSFGATVKSVDATIPAGPARPELFSRN